MNNTSHISGQKGFTLIELLITIAVAGILAAISIMNTPQVLANYKVRGAARQLYSDMQMARMRAIKEGKDYAVERVDTSYCVKRMTGTNWDQGCDIGGEDTADEIIKTINLSTEYSGVKVCNSTRINFKANGTAEMEGSTDGIRISKISRVQRVYISSTWTGNIRIEDLTAGDACP